MRECVRVCDGSHGSDGRQAAAEAAAGRVCVLVVVWGGEAAPTCARTGASQMVRPCSALRASCAWALSWKRAKATGPLPVPGTKFMVR